MIYIVEGDLLESDSTIICHQANCQSTMGRGIAEVIKDKFPEAYRADLKFRVDGKIATPEQRLGKFSSTFSKDGSKVIVNLYGQLNYGRERVLYTNYNALLEALDSMMGKIPILEEKGFNKVKIGLPYGMGCVRAGGDWNKVMDILKDLSDKHDRDLYVYKK